MKRQNRSSGVLRAFFWFCAISFLLGLTKASFSQITLYQSRVYPSSGRQQKNIIERPYKADEVLVKFKPYTAQSTANTVMNTMQVQPVKYYRKVDVHLTKTSPGKSVEETVRQFKENSSVEYAEPNYICYTVAMPNDPAFQVQWGLHNTGQTGGTMDADIDAPEAWDIQTGSSDVVIAVIDTGVDYNHIDLVNNMWVNTGETPGDGIDNDGNGYVDDVHGINALTDGGDPMDDNATVYHGTHCAGVIAANANNATGITGISWSSKIMALKFLGESGSGPTSDGIECIEYMVNMKNTYGVNVRVASNSWGGGGGSALEDAVRLARDNDILFIAAAGNAGTNNDLMPHYPASYDLLNVVSVAASDHNDAFASFSCYGYNTVDVAAPGVEIWSTKRGDDYQYLGGTSMATPHVAGLCALICSQYPSMSYLEVKERLLRSVDTKSHFTDTLTSGGRINAYAALTMNDIQGPFIYSLSPGAASYENEIIIEGSQFGNNHGAGYVTFFDNLTASVISWSDHQIVCTVPAGCQEGPVAVTTDEGLQSNEKFFLLAGSISGSITKEISGDPLIATAIEIYDSNGNFISYTWANMDGHYTVNGMPTGDYYAYALNFQGYVGEWYQDADPDDGDSPPIHVEAPDETSNIDFVLALGGSILGTITRDPTGEPIEDVRITLYDSDGNWVESLFTWSDPEGHYTVNGLSTGDYYVRTGNDQGYVDEWYQSVNPFYGDPPPVHVNAPDRIEAIDFALVLGGTISGRVILDPTGEPLRGITIIISDNNGNYIGSDRTDSAGNYSLDSLPNGDFYVRTRNDQGYIDEWYQDAVYAEGDPPPVHVDAPEETPNIDFALELGGAITGQVTADVTGEPLWDVTIFAYSSTATYSINYSWSDPAGHYTINALPTGDYYLRTSNDQGYIDEWYVDANPADGDPPPIHVDAPLLTPNIDFGLAPGGTITGIVTDCLDSSIIIDNVIVCAYEWDAGNASECGFTDVTGSYEIRGLPGGNYQVCGQQYNDATYIKKCNEFPLELVVEDVYNLDFCMEVGGSISGTIYCENCSGGFLFVWALNESDPDLSNIDHDSWGGTYLIEPGAYTIGGLPYGTPIWVYAEWMLSLPSPAEKYYGAYEGNPIILTQGSPFPTDIDIHIDKTCDSDADCDGICDPGESAPNCSGSDECPYDPENDIDGDSICGDIDNCPHHSNPDQEDTFPPEGNGIGDACECEGDFDCDMDQDGTDAAIFKRDFGRSSYGNPCTEENPCSADFDADGVIDGMDAHKFKEDFGRCSYNNCCPPCAVEP